ncbi:MAG: hydroxymethylbilane synthase [Pseudomonadota bacterium]
MQEQVRIATRESALALWQANHVKDLISSAFPDVVVEICGMTTEGDRNKVSPLSRLGGKGVFVKELESALLERRVDIAVHSMKDVPAELPAGLEIGAVCERADPFDAFVSNRWPDLQSLPAGSRVGTSSLRRRLQIEAAFPELVFPELRGNVDTRLRKLDEGDYDAIILAAAGLKRLGLGDRIRQQIAPSLCIPAAGQGAVGIECRTDDSGIKAILARVNDPETALRIACERLVSAGLGASCNLPIAAFSTCEAGEFAITGFVANPEGTRRITVARQGPVALAESLAQEVVAELIDQGALALIP